MPEINLTAGVLPPPACFASEQDRLDAYAAALIAQFATSPEWVASAIAPVAPNLGLYWLRLDAGGNPVEVLKYNTTAPAGWARLTTQFTYGVGGGTANVYTVTLSPASPGVNQAYRTGATYAFGAASANTGASTLSVDGLAAKAITKYGTVPLVANDMVNGQMCVVVYDAFPAAESWPEYRPGGLRTWNGSPVPADELDPGIGLGVGLHYASGELSVDSGFRFRGYLFAWPRSRPADLGHRNHLHHRGRWLCAE